MARIRIRFLAIAADAAGTSGLEVSVKDGARLSDVISLVYRLYPGLRRVSEDVKIAVIVNGLAVDRDYTVKDGDEVAFIPPASGGA